MQKIEMDIHETCTLLALRIIGLLGRSLAIG
jgi:hypothetical protein